MQRMQNVLVGVAITLAVAIVGGGTNLTVPIPSPSLSTTLASVGQPADGVGVSRHDDNYLSYPGLPPAASSDVGNSRESPSRLPSFTSRGGARPYEPDTVFKTVSVQVGTEGEATFYHPSLARGIMRSGQPYNPSDPTIVAVADIQGEPAVELGTPLQVCHEGKCILAVAQDTGRFPANHIDLSEGAWLSLGIPLSKGRISITWMILRQESYTEEMDGRTVQ